MKIIIVSLKKWNIDNALRFKENNPMHDVIIIDNNKDFKVDKIKIFDPEYIFFPHWSYKIKKEVYEEYKCVVFHMTDLPFGRGGSPLQNLIARGFTKTKISAIDVVEKLDAGDIYLKKEVSLDGTCEDILKRSSDIIFNEMIPLILNNNFDLKKQVGKELIFKRRCREDGEIKKSFNLDKIYDYIRMLDGEGYPKAYINFGNYCLEFSEAKLNGGKLKASVEIMERRDE